MMARIHQQGNTRSNLKRRSRTVDPMTAYDRLPPDLRAWLMHSALLWSAQSALRLWRKYLRMTGGDLEEARHHLTRVERETLKRDV
ncbi:DUF6525 family protein [Paracoccus seriniphilus]|uniref:Uncharacterized protein n=1 Tax=Paracoccus seriniphilus TaxID=184748 RepID=A0A239Q1T3_9RHOB|nr:DUF6525 family protein [Paracoccus seriniphilus]WCR15760.1 hypothetical protein JHW44_14760 [Paracoccus seriniphilus]SNT76193.1 hypothetical protein SAMN05444959_11658 [Paracoccus seriniphilus]